VRHHPVARRILNSALGFALAQRANRFGDASLPRLGCFGLLD